ncbi:MAG: TIM barrel protein [Planctomycetota bacterium]
MNQQRDEESKGRGADRRPAGTRRDLLRATAALGTAAALSPAAASATEDARAPGAPWFEVSLAQWSLHRTLFRAPEEGGITNLDFPRVARERCGVDAIEYVNRFFETRTKDGGAVPRGADFGYLRELGQACDDAGVRSLLIMVDGEGNLADPDDARRRDAVENHFRWVAAAAFLGCHAIRVNAAGEGDADAQAARAADSLRRIARVSKDYGISVIVENHGGLSSDGRWLKGVMERADDPFVGTLPDFGNFYEYDRYQGVEDLMPFAKAVSAKSYAFDDGGDETTIDYRRMLGLVKAAGYRGHVGIEYEGKDGDELAGIARTRSLLETVRAELA